MLEIFSYLRTMLNPLVCFAADLSTSSNKTSKSLFQVKPGRFQCYFHEQLILLYHTKRTLRWDQLTIFGHTVPYFLLFSSISNMRIICLIIRMKICILSQPSMKCYTRNNKLERHRVNCYAMIKLVEFHLNISDSETFKWLYR